MNWIQQLKGTLEKLKAEGQYRSLKKYDKCDFISNDYLGIINSGELNEYITEYTTIFETADFGSGGSRLLRGNTETHENAELFFKQYFNCADTLIANSGYDANLAVLSALPQRKDIILYDEKVHASIKEGMRLSFASKYSVRHNDLNDLEKKIKKYRHLKPEAVLFFVFETVYSMDGDIPNLTELVSIAQEYEVVLIADEAHAFGVFGKKGEGLLQSQKLHKHVAVRIFGFGKAAGTYGAVIAVQDRAIKEYLINTARSIIYTTALSPFQVEIMQISAELIESNPEWREELHENIQTFQEKLPYLDIESPIIPIIIGDNTELLHVFNKLQRKGFDVAMVRSPTVPRGQERLRISVHAHNLEIEILSLLNTLLPYL
jgi:8-amino-7-oxononanoate synthase